MSEGEALLAGWVILMLAVILIALAVGRRAD